MEQRGIAIVTDSTADIPPFLAEAYGIEVVPAVLTLDGKSYLDNNFEISRSEFYKRIPALATPATTAAPSIATFEHVYERLLSRGNRQVLSIHVASSLSSMVDIATQAAKSFGDRVIPYDSGQLSLGIGFQVIEVAIQAMRGAPLQTLLSMLERFRKRIKVQALIDSMEFLKRSGRVNAITAHVGDLLRIKLLLEVNNGKVVRAGQTRTRSRGIGHLMKYAQRWAPFERLAVGHTATPEAAYAFADRLRNLSSNPLLVVDVTTVIGAHLGPGGIGVLGLRK